MYQLQTSPSFNDVFFINELDHINQILYEIDSNLSIELFNDVASAALLLSQESRSIFYSTKAFGTSLQMNFEAQLREKLALIGWTPYDGKGGAAFTISPCKKHAFYALTGTEDVGLIKGNPTNKNNKGNELRNAIIEPQIIFQNNTVLHVLLFHYNAGHLSMELSIPNQFEKRHIQSWSQRILLPVYDSGVINSSIEVNRKDSAPSPDTEIIVKRRKSAG